MTTFRLKWVQAFTDRHGKKRHYYRRPGVKKVALPGEPGSKEFMDAYHACEAGAPKREIGADRVVPKSFAALVVSYYKSTAFKTLKPNTQAVYRNIIERLRRDYGHLMVHGIKRKHLNAILDKFADRPGAQYNVRRVLRLLMAHAHDNDWRTDNPMLGMRRARSRSEGFKTWTDEEIAAFEARHPEGSRARLALALLLYTGQRRSDVVRMGRQHIRDGKIHVAQAKSGGRTKLWIRMLPDLVEALSWAPKDQLTFLVTAQGAPFTPAGFTNWFRECVREAGLPDHCKPHGLRKAAARRLAEAGCTENEIMAITGHKNHSEVTLYTAAANQERLADEAMSKVEKRTSRVNPDGPGRQNGQKAQ